MIFEQHSKNKKSTGSRLTEIRISKIFKAHIDRAVEELGVSYDATALGRFNKTAMWLGKNFID